MHLKYINKLKRDKNKTHRGGAGDRMARAIDDGKDGHRTTVNPIHYTLIWAKIACKKNEISYLGISSNTLLALEK